MLCSHFGVPRPVEQRVGRELGTETDPTRIGRISGRYRHQHGARRDHRHPGPSRDRQFLAQDQRRENRQRRRRSACRPAPRARRRPAASPGNSTARTRRSPDPTDKEHPRPPIDARKRFELSCRPDEAAKRDRNDQRAQERRQVGVDGLHAQLDEHRVSAAKMAARTAQNCQLTKRFGIRPGRPRRSGA
jgi:hypothetical protein